MTGAVLNLREFSNDSPIVIESSEQAIEMTVSDVLRWIAPGAPPGEALKFLLTCRTARLNPFLGEAFLVNLGGKFSTIIAKAGYLKRAQEHPDFAGFEAGIIVQQIHPQTKLPMGEVRDIVGTMLPASHIVVGGWAKVWRRGIDLPTHSRLSMAEYNKATATWKSTPCTMIRKTALVHAIREAFAIGDSYDTSEVNAVPNVPVRAGVVRPGGPQLASPDSSWKEGNDPLHAAMGRKVERNAALELAYQPHEDPTLPPAFLAELQALIAEAGMTEYQLHSTLARRGVDKVTDLSVADARTLIGGLRNHVEANRVVENFPALPEGPPAHALPENQLVDPALMGPPSEGFGYDGEVANDPDGGPSGDASGDAGEPADPHREARDLVAASPAR